MKLLYFFENLRNPILDEIMYYLTYLGSEITFIIVAMVTLWCVNKKFGYYLMTVSSYGLLMNQFLKSLFRIPRPWVIDPEFTIVEKARSTADGFSFPSGHTQNATGMFGSILKSRESGKEKILLGFLIAIVAFSRMYLGVHTPYDVGFSMILATLVLNLMYYLLIKDDRLNIVLKINLICAVLLIVFQYVMNGIVSEDLTEEIKTSYLAMGLSSGFMLSVYLDKKYLNYRTEATKKEQILKAVLGLFLIGICFACFHAFFKWIFPAHPIRDFFIFFLLAIVAGCIWPYLFTKYLVK